ncbi:MAG: transglutaminase domain-containing protein, partial [Frankiales bacterium]|nr:transglutaminase domain-containing protein [Frankiales bacterium]
RNETDGLQYAVNSTKPDWTVAQLESAKTIDPQATAMLQLPASVSLQVRNLTTHVLAAAHATTPFDKALAIQQFLTSPRFTYDVNVASSASSDALANFLLHTHRGFCQQYASAMAVMARIARIPSRVAVGFTHGEQQADGTWTVTTRDAHAWPELEFGGIGWVPFEPTPRTDGQTQVPNYAVAQSNSKAGKGGAPDQSQKIAAGKRGGKASAPVQSRAQLLDHNVEKVSTGGRAATSAAEHHGSSARAIAAWSLLVLALLFLVIPGVVRIASRRRRWRHAVTPAQEASAAWAELRASAIDADAGWIDGLSPRATARVLRAESGAFATAEIRALDRIVEAVQRAWYAPDADRARTDTLEQDVADLRIAMMAEATIWQRLARRIWPRSTMQSGRELLGRFGALLDASDMAAARLRARLRPRHAG